MKNTIALLLFAVLFACNNKKDIDLLIINGTVYQPDGTEKIMDLAIQGDKILEIGEDLSSIYNVNETINAEGKFVMPGLIDGHAHFSGIGESLQTVNLLGGTTWQHVLSEVEKKVESSAEGEWIIGRGWHQEKWTDQPSRSVNGYPAHDDISAISPNNPVLLSHASGHGILVNAKAMELAKIDSNTESPKGGLIVKDETGEPIGIFQENASQLVGKLFMEKQANRSKEDIKSDWLKTFLLAQEHCLAYGITSLHDAGIGIEDGLWMQELAEQNDMKIRIYAMLSQYAVNTATPEQLTNFVDFNNSYLSTKAVKAYMDGALGSRGAWLLEPYTDKPDYSGENVTPIEELEETARIAKQYNMQLCIHAIGDRGNREVIDVFEKVMGNKLIRSRWRIEHAQHLHPDDISRIGGLGIIASMQTIHCTSDSPFVVNRLGEKRAEEGAYVWQSLLEKNVRIANGTDAPVESVNPFDNLYAAVTRKRVGEQNAFYPMQVLSRSEALDSYTKWNAYASFQEEEKGTIEKGKLADIVILDTDLLTCDEEDILDTKVLFTIVGGNIVYKQKED